MSEVQVESIEMAEALFDAEARLRAEAVVYSDEKTNNTRKRLRAAAIAYADVVMSWRRRQRKRSRSDDEAHHRRHRAPARSRGVGGDKRMTPGPWTPADSAARDERYCQAKASRATIDANGIAASRTREPQLAAWVEPCSGCPALLRAASTSPTTAPSRSATTRRRWTAAMSGTACRRGMRERSPLPSCAPPTRLLKPSPPAKLGQLGAHFTVS